MGLGPHCSIDLFKGRGWSALSRNQDIFYNVLNPWRYTGRAQAATARPLPATSKSLRGAMALELAAAVPALFGPEDDEQLDEAPPPPPKHRLAAPEQTPAYRARAEARLSDARHAYSRELHYKNLLKKNDAELTAALANALLDDSAEAKEKAVSRATHSEAPVEATLKVNC